MHGPNPSKLQLPWHASYLRSKATFLDDIITCTKLELTACFPVRLYSRERSQRSIVDHLLLIILAYLTAPARSSSPKRMFLPHSVATAAASHALRLSQRATASRTLSVGTVVRSLSTSTPEMVQFTDKKWYDPSISADARVMSIIEDKALRASQCMVLHSGRYLSFLPWINMQPQRRLPAVSMHPLSDLMKFQDELCM